MKKLSRIVRSTLVGFVFVSAYGFSMNYDNRFFPFGPRLYSRSHERYSNIIPELFFVVVDHAWASEGEMGLFQLFGDYDLNAIGHALEIIGKQNPVATQWRAAMIPWHMDGKIRALGIALSYNQSLHNNVSWGISSALMNVRSWLEPRLGKVGFALGGADDLAELDAERRQANKELEFCQVVNNTTGFTDIDTYLRLGNMWHYPSKFKRIDVGIKVGLLLPSGVKRNPNNPASIPFAGDGHTGMYTAVDAEFELRDMIKIGFELRLIGRFARNLHERLPVDQEPLNFGAVVGTFRIRPFLTLVGTPYLLLEDIREGFGIGIQYRGIKHFGDCWTDQRAIKTIPVKRKRAEHLSAWVAEYLSVNLLYDFAKRTEKRNFAPLVYAVVDIPVQWLGAWRASKSFKVSLGIEFNF
jgi:hypothetical protein